MPPLDQHGPPAGGTRRECPAPAHCNANPISCEFPPALRWNAMPVERPPFETIALVLQGGGALGAYQAGVMEGLAAAGIEPDWVAGISIGAINAALIAGNEPGDRIAKLREFWDTVSRPAAYP